MGKHSRQEAAGWRKMLLEAWSSCPGRAGRQGALGGVSCRKGQTTAEGCPCSGCGVTCRVTSPGLALFTRTKQVKEVASGAEALPSQQALSRSLAPLAAPWDNEELC